jgi:hypothetical protein
MRALTLLSLLYVAGCGEAPSFDLTPVVTVHGSLLANDTFELRLYVFGDRTADGKVLPCTVLMTGVTLPNDAGVDKVASASLPFSAGVAREATIANIPYSERSRVVFIEAVDSASTVIGRGCQSGVYIGEGEQKALTIGVFPL